MEQEAALRVVVADNDRAAADAVARTIQGLGYQVTRCSGLKEMFVALKPLKTVVLFIDLNIDGTDCFEVIPRLVTKAQEVGRKYVIVAMSEFGGPTVALSVAKAGAFRYASKPFHPATLEQVLQEAVAEARKPTAPAHAPAAAGAHAPAAGAHAPAAGAHGGAVPGVHGGPLATGHGAAHEANVQLEIAPSKTEGVIDQDSVDRLIIPPSEGEGTGLAGGRLHPMERMRVINVAPEEPGVLTLYDTDRAPLKIEWADNLCQRLAYYVDLHPAMSEVARSARHFEVLPTLDRDQLPKIFDRLVNLTGKYPALMKEAPAGSRHLRPPEKTRAPLPEDGRVTAYKKTSDPKLVEQVRAALRDNPSDPDTQDWLAFTLYSNDLLDEAIELYTKLITAGSRREEHFFYCGNACYKHGDAPRAIKLWKVALSLNPNGMIGKKSAARIDAALSGKDPDLTHV